MIFVFIEIISLLHGCKKSVQIFGKNRKGKFAAACLKYVRISRSMLQQ